MGYAMTWAPGIEILIGETLPTRTRALFRQRAIGTLFSFPARCSQYLVGK